jgi:ribosomal protein S18 acetylase RimI-like enzyme
LPDHGLRRIKVAMVDMAVIETGASTVKTAQRENTQRVLNTLTLAFAADPAVRWMYPDAQQYLQYFPAGGAAIARRTAFVSEGYAGAALWLPPDTAADAEVLTALLEKSVADRERADTFAVFEEMARYHPDEPHWYLPLIGVDPARQGCGYGSAMMQHALRRCDDERLPAYLESTNPRNIPLYERHGFEVMGEIRIGNCPPIFPMLRAARR